MALVLRIEVDDKKAAASIKRFSKRAGADVRGLETQTKKSGTGMSAAFGGVSKDADRLRVKTSGLTSEIGALRNQLLIFGFATAGVVGVLKKIITESSKLTESINAVNVVFGSGADTILKFGETAARSVGIANSEFNQLATLTGALLKDSGLSLEGVAEKTILLTERAADLASVFDTDVSDAMNAINAAVRGESEAIRRYAGDTIDATLQTFLFSQGIMKNVSQLTQQEKRLQVVALILEQTKDVQGDFLRTQGEFANQLRITTSRITDLTATGGFLNDELGQTLAIVNSGFDALDKNEELAGKFASGDFRGAINDFFRIPSVTLDDLKFAFGLIDKLPDKFPKVGVRFPSDLGLETGIPSDFLGDLDRQAAAQQNILNVERLRSEALKENLELLRGQVTQIEDILPPMEATIGAIDRIGSAAERWADIQSAIGLEIPKLPEQIEDVSTEMSKADQAAGRFSQNLARALVSGRGLEKALLNAAINLGLSLIPGGSLFGGFFAHGGIAPGGGIPSIVGEGGGAPEIVQSASPIRVTPLTTNDNRTNNSGTTNFVFPNVKTLDRFTLENEIIPMLEKIKQG